jgi:hypothetical protein
MGIHTTDIDNICKGVLRRTATAAEQATYDTPTYTQAGTVNGFVASTDNGQQVRPIIRLFRVAFCRTPDSGGLDYWVAGYRGQGSTIGYGGTALLNIMNSMATYSEYQSQYPASMSNVDFVTKVYAQALKRAPDSAGGAYWVNLLDTGQKSRTEMIVEFSQSSECINTTDANVTVFQKDCGNLASWAYQDPI